MAERQANEAPPSKWRYLIGCWLAIVGYFAGGMVGVGIAKLVGQLQRCPAPPGFPACNFELYFRVGTTIGLVLLPSVVVWKLWRSVEPPDFSQRFSGAVDEGGDTISGTWEISRDGVAWERDFDLIYTRVSR